MDDILNTQFDTWPSVEKKFESVQSRFNRLHVPRTTVEWLVCDICGTVLNKLLYGQHLIQHDLIGACWQMYGFELIEQKEHNRKVQLIRENEQRRARRTQQHGLKLSEESGSSSSSSSSDKSSSSSSSDSESEIDVDVENSSEMPSYSTSSTVKVEETKAKSAVKNWILPRKRRMAVENRIGRTSKEAEEKAESESTKGIAKLSQVPPPSRKSSVVKVKAKVKSAVVKKLPKKRKAIVKNGQTKGTEKKMRALLEKQMKETYLGMNHNRVFVDNSRAQEVYFDKQGHVPMAKLNNSEAQTRRRSLRSARKAEELHFMI